MIEIGAVAPTFSLPDVVSGEKLSLQGVLDDNTRGILVMFICNHCPYVIHIQEPLVRIIKTYQQKNIQCVAINANDVENYPEDSPENMQLRARQLGFTFPYLFDAEQSVAKSYNATCTPDFFLFNSELALFYRGRFDASTPGNDKPVTGVDLTYAMDCLIEGKNCPEEAQHPSIGCNIKWKQEEAI